MVDSLECMVNCMGWGGGGGGEARGEEMRIMQSSDSVTLVLTVGSKFLSLQYLQPQLLNGERESSTVSQCR